MAFGRKVFNLLFHEDVSEERWQRVKMAVSTIVMVILILNITVMGLFNLYYNPSQDA